MTDRFRSRRGDIRHLHGSARDRGDMFAAIVSVLAFEPVSPVASHAGFGRGAERRVISARLARAPALPVSTARPRPWYAAHRGFQRRWPEQREASRLRPIFV
jgi:hypothetical protein